MSLVPLNNMYESMPGKTNTHFGDQPISVLTSPEKRGKYDNPKITVEPPSTSK